MCWSRAMFSGIIEEIGKVQQLSVKKDCAVLKVRAKKIVKGVKLGASFAVNGACLTVTKIRKSDLTFDIMRETLRVTNLGLLKVHAPVNLERSLKANGSIDGHFVTGHVDAVSLVENKITRANYTELVIRIPKDLRRFIVAKGSVCLDGVSLTVGAVRKVSFSVYLIPFTKRFTTLGLRQKGDQVNLEADILAKYVLNKGY